MAEKSRGIVLTIFAVLFALMALSNFSKPLHMSPNAGFVFFGTKLTGTPNLIIAPLFGILLAAYAYGIWTMRKSPCQLPTSTRRMSSSTCYFSR
jgi:hypothetical protein